MRVQYPLPARGGVNCAPAGAGGRGASADGGARRGRDAALARQEGAGECRLRAGILGDAQGLGTQHRAAAPQKIRGGGGAVPAALARRRWLLLA